MQILYHFNMVVPYPTLQFYMCVMSLFWIKSTKDDIVRFNLILLHINI